ncbi:MAG TPA: hypothetical protein VIJ75_00135 [Hanamia sp.]
MLYFSKSITPVSTFKSKITLLLLIIISVANIVRAQDNSDCKCPPLKLYVYDTKVGFPLEKNPSGKEAGDYTEALNSGQWLGGAFTKQESDELKTYQNIMPGASTGNTYQLPPNGNENISDEIDFISYAVITKNGAASYTMQINIEDRNRKLAFSKSTNFSDLGKADDQIDAIMNSLPVIKTLRDYQKKLREESGFKDWVAVKWKATPAVKKIKQGQQTTVVIQVFDCVDNMPLKEEKINVKLSDNAYGKLTPSTVVTSQDGKAFLTFTAGNKSGLVNVYPDFAFKNVIHEKESQALECGNDADIIVNVEKKWVVSYTVNSYSSNSQTGGADEMKDESHAHGRVSMIVDAAAPLASGYTSFNTGEGDKLIQFDVSGNWEERRSDITREYGVIVEKTLRNYTGEADKKVGIEFTYDPSPDGGVTLNSGISFNKRGNDKFWKFDYDSHSLKLVDNSDASSSYGFNLGVGHSKDIVKRTKNGFTIDYNQSKDTSYTIDGERHVLKSGTQYHVIISWMSANNVGIGKGTKED